MEIGIIGVGGTGIEIAAMASRYMEEEIKEKKSIIMVDTDQREIMESLIKIYEIPEEVWFKESSESDKKELYIVEEKSVGIYMGKKLVEKGCSGDKELGSKALRSSINEIAKRMEEFDVVIVCSAIGGGTGSNAYKIAKKAKEIGKKVYSFVIMRKDDGEKRKIIKEMKNYSDFMLIAGSEKINLSLSELDKWILLEKSMGYLLYSIYMHKEKLQGIGTCSIAEDASPEAMVNNIEDYNTGYFSFEEAEEVRAYTGYQDGGELEFNGKRVKLRYNEGITMETIFLGII